MLNKLGEMMARVHSRGYRSLKSEINIVPLLDVLLVLLLILMATATIFIQSVEVDLPNTIDSKTVSIGDNLPVVVEVSGVSQYSMIMEHDRLLKLLPEQVVSEVKHRLAMNSKTVFLIGGSKNVPYNEIIKVLHLLHQAGVKSVGLMTQPV